MQLVFAGLLFSSLRWILFQKLLYPLAQLRFAARVAVIQFANPTVANVSLFIHQVDGRPRFHLPAVPVLVVSIYQYRVSDAELFDAPRHVGRDALALGFRRMRADNYDILVSKLFLPICIGGQIGATIAAGECPELNDGYFAAPASQVDCFAVGSIDPGAANQFRRG